MPKVMIEVRCNEYAMRDENPNVPWSPEEIANDAVLCEDAGASIFHFTLLFMNTPFNDDNMFFLE